MEDKKVILEYSNKDHTVPLVNGVSFVNDSEIINYLEKEKYNTDDNKLRYKIVETTFVSKLLKIRINIDLVGYFILNFDNNLDNKNKCLNIIDKVSVLKDSEDFSLENQCKKIKRVIEIINNYGMAFVSFVLTQNIPNKYIDFKDIKLSFPLLFINKVPNKKTVKTKKILVDLNTPFFSTDYLFNLLFALFASFSLHTSVSLFSNNNWKGTLFIILSLALLCILNYCLFLIFYSDNWKQLKGQKLIMAMYLCFGTSVGLIISILISQYYLNISYNGWLIFIDIFAFVLCVGSVFSSKIINLIKKR